MSQTPRANPLLDKVRMPGATFRLPSGGGFYKQGEVEFEKGKAEVYVSPMTTMDEVAITSLDKLLNGTAVTEVFSRCIPSIKAPREMLSSDVDYLMVALRIVSMGKDTDVTYNHKCQGKKGADSKERTYTVNVEEQILDKARPLTADALKRYQTDLSTGLHVKFRPLTYGGLLEVQELLDMIQRLLDKRGREEDREARDKIVDELNSVTTIYFQALMSNVIESMDDITDPELINEALDAMSLPIREELMDSFNALEEWGQPSKVKIRCQECQKEVEVALDLNPVSFFTTRSRPKTST